MPNVYTAGSSLLPVQKQADQDLASMGALVLSKALQESRLERPDMLIVSNMLADELESQKHLGPLIASAAGLPGLEAFAVRGAMAGGAVALRTAWLALMSGQLESVAIVGVERMHGSEATPHLAKALHRESEQSAGHSMISINASLMQLYLDHYQVAHDSFANFAVNAHRNACSCSHAVLQKELTAADAMQSRLITAPIRLSDCSPVCDGAAALILTNNPDLADGSGVQLLASEIATDHIQFAKRPDPLALEAARVSANKVWQRSGLRAADIDFFEVHDAFSIMACLCLEAAGFAERGQGWRLALEADIFLQGRLPIATHGGLKARGHPIGATAIYQAIEIARQLSGNAGANQIQRPIRHALMQSIGGAGTTLVTNLFGV
ncbi:MAG: hypothetical protein KDK39_02985 [Leptospiraceae bacterium]|nr:hypothetical protein [Leptospiraceae bacterium]